ncbi:hypothetical protein G5V57_25065 [Nordella sp. HKS 07]|uniref:hypothetical protein n=1 Tax=Nordella sp. HKS 07 TaxID=2712222 RepID=UPI0013E19CE7|nr:hypothetical protein [Nordella sp. HKS 07]QIG50713.1 hypothetical protein G5V57_25065 [Nordella sp. HKS 07]
MTQVKLGGQFIRCGFWLLLLGLLMSFGMVLHYVVGAQYPTGDAFLKNVTLWYACPWTLSTAVVLGGSLGMIVIGVVYAMVGSQDAGGGESALPICVVALVAIFLTGYAGYFAVDAMWPSFYYSPITAGKNVWLFMQLGCMVLYAIGVLIAFKGIRRASYALV